MDKRDKLDKLFNIVVANTLAKSTSPETKATSDAFVEQASSILGELEKKLDNLEKCLEALSVAENEVTNCFQSLGHTIQCENDSLVEFSSALSKAGHLGNSMHVLYEQRKKDVNAQRRRVGAIKERMKAYSGFAKHKEPIDHEALTAFNALKTDFVSELLDQCFCSFESQLELSRRTVAKLAPVANTELPKWQKICCNLQEHSRDLRITAVPWSGDAVLTRGIACPIFGSPLDQALWIPGFHIPQILFDLSDAILTVPGVLDEEGLFRVNATQADLNKVESSYDEGKIVPIWSQRPHCIAGAMKKWFRVFPKQNYLIPSGISATFIDVNDDPVMIKNLVSDLPEINRRCLRKLMEVGVAVAGRCSKNKMTIVNVSKIFGPLIINKDSLDPLKQIDPLNNLAKTMLEQFAVIFADP